VNHVVHFDAVDKLGIVTHFSLNSVEFGVKFLQIGKSSQMNPLHITSYVFVCEEKLNNFMAKLNVSSIRGRLFEPLFQQSGPNLRLALI